MGESTSRCKGDSRKPKRGVQNTLEHESTFGTQEYHSALLECWTVL